MIHPKDKPAEALPKLYLGVIDFDSAVYRCAAVHGDDEDGLPDAKVTLMSFVQDNIVNPCQCEEYLFVVTGQENFRHGLAVSKPYKGHRAQEKPIHYLELFDWAIGHFNCLVANDMEADDYVVNAHQKYQSDCVLIGIDKDNLQSPGWHYNFVKNEARYISQAEAQWCLAFQLLRGDPGDNIPGLPGIGEAKARQFLIDNPDLPPMKVVYDVYKAKSMLGAYYEEQYKLLYMLRDTVLDFESSFTQHIPVTEFAEVEGDFEGIEGAPNVTI